MLSRYGVGREFDSSAREKAIRKERLNYEPSWGDDYEMPDGIELTEGRWIKSPFVQQFQELNLVSLDRDMKSVFPDSQALN